MKRRLAIYACLIAAIVGIVVAALKSERMEEEIRTYLVRAASAELDMLLTMDDFEIGVLPPAIHVGGVTLVHEQGPGPEIRLHRGMIAVRPWPSSQGNLVITHLQLDGLRAALTFNTEQLRSQAGASTPQQFPLGDLPIELRHLAMWNSDVALTIDDRRLRLATTDIEIESSGAENEVSLSIENGLIHWHDTPEAFDARIRATITGPLWAPTHAQIESAQVHVPEGQISVYGIVGITNPDTSDIAFAASGSLSALHRFLPSTPAAEGSIALRGTIRGAPVEPSARLTITLNDVSYSGTHYGNAEIEAVYATDRIKVEALRWQHAQAGMITGSGTLQILRAMDIQGNLRLHDFSLPHFLELTDLPGAWVRMMIGGDVQISGQLEPLRLTVDADLQVPHFESLDGSYRSVLSERMLVLRESEIWGRVDISESRAQLKDVMITTGASNLRVDGSLSFDETSGFNLRGVSNSLSLQDLGTLAGGLTLAGDGPAAVAIEGPYDDPTISATVEANDFGALDFALGDIKATLVYQAPTLELDRATLKAAGGTMTGDGRIHFDSSPPTLEGNFSTARVALPKMLVMLGTQPELARRFEAQAKASLNVSGPATAPIGVTEVSSKELRVDGVSFGPMAMTCGFGGDTDIFWADGTLNPQGGRAQGVFRWHRDDNMEISFDVAGLRLDLIRPFIGDIPISGSLSGQARLQGKQATLAGDFAVTAEDLIAFGMTLEHGSLKGKADGGLFVGDGSLLSGDAPAHVEFRLGGDGIDHTATFKLPAVDVARIYPMPVGVDLEVDATIESRGDLTRPESLRAIAVARRGVLQWEETTLNAVAPWRVVFEKQSFGIVDLRMRSADLRVDTSGRAGTDGSLSLRILAGGDIRDIVGLVPQVTYAGGPFNADLVLTGTVLQPMWRGEIEVNDCTARLAVGDQLVDGITGRLHVSGRTLYFRDTQAESGGGKVRVAGEATWGNDAELELNIRTELESVRLQPTPDVDLTVSGAVTLNGPANGSSLAGKLRVDALRYTAHTDLDRILRRSPAVLSIPSSTDVQPMGLRVAVVAPNNIIFSSNVLEAEFGADLMVTGTLDRPGLLGSITPLWARARYRDNVFDVRRASIDFIEEYRVFPSFQVLAHTQACGMEIDVSLAGNPERYTVVPSGKDEDGVADPQDVLTCLQFGLRLRDFRGHDAASLTDTRWGGLDALWTVSGMDEKVRRLLPIDVDEFRLTSSWSSLAKKTTPYVLIGKEVGNRVELKYQRSLTELNDQSFTLEYELSKAARLQGSWASVTEVPVGDLGLDLRLRWEFR